MKKNNIRIVVQGGAEFGHEFGFRLQKICEDLAIEYKGKLITHPEVQFMTSDQNGRQTATIQFTTVEEEEK